MTTVLLNKRYNRKDPAPSQSLLASDGAHYRCAWIEDSITIHSDGNVSCGLDDPHGQRSYGNIRTQSVEEIFANPEYRAMQEALWSGKHCRHCGHFRPETAAGAEINPRPKLPSRLVVETTVTCNIRCTNLPCFANNDPNETTRDAAHLGLDAFNAMIDQLAPGLKTVNFYNYGEPFMNRRAEDMLLHLRAKCPDAFVVTSTNGIPLSNAARAEKVALARPNRVTFTIGGATQESYVRYHVGGRFDQALQGMANVCKSKRAHGQALPQVVWRYLAFHWNDSDAEIEQALAMAREIGVDRFSLYLTNTPPGSRSIRLSPGSPSFWKYAQYIHLDDEGELNHIYRCKLPDADGLYPAETLGKLGAARWTSSRARLRLRNKEGRLGFAAATNRVGGIGGTFMLRTPWRKYKLPYAFGEWSEISLEIPRRFHDHDAFECDLTAPDYWYPANEDGQGDLRCLGVLLKAEDELSEERTGAPRNLLRLPDAEAAEAPDYLRVLPREVA